MRSRLLVALTGTAALMAGVIAATSPAVATSGTPPAIPGTSSNFQLVGRNPLYHRGMNAAPAIFGNYLYVGNRSDGSSTCPDGSTGCTHVHPGILRVIHRGWGIVDLNVHGSVRLREKRLVSRKDLGVESNPRETSRPCIIPQDFPGTRSWNSARWCTRLRPDLAIRNGRRRSGCSIRLW